MPRLSVIVPVFGQPELLSACLASIRASNFSDYELLVGDDGSPDPDAIRQVADRFAAQLIRCDVRQGSAATRNRAARSACGNVLVFIDADVTIRKDVLQRFAQTFEADCAPDAVIGSYDRDPGGRNRISHFRNLVHSHAHQRSRRDASTFWTGCGAIRRSTFLQIGGFKESFDRPSIEDVELGLRLRQAGGRIVLDPAIQGKHHKDWTLGQMVWTDLTARAIPWAALVREHGFPRDLNFRISDRVGAALTVGVAAMVFIAIRHQPLYWAAVVAGLAAIAILQRSLLGFLAQAKGRLFAINCFPWLLLYNLVCVAGLAAGLVRAEHRRDRWWIPSLLAFTALIVGLQLAGGAYRAEFDATPDEPPHFVSSLMVYDYLHTLPRGNPVRWAELYYLHYPKVAIGHWPPLFFMMEGCWWLFLPPSRTTAMLFNAVVLLLAAGIFYHRTRDIAPGWLSSAAGLLLLLTPVLQQAAGQVMSETVCLLWSVLLIDALVRLVRRPSLATVALAGLWLFSALLTKGTGICLVAAPVLALFAAGKLRAVLQPRMLRPLAPVAVVLLAGIGWYALQGTVMHQNLAIEGGLDTSVPWDAPEFWHLAGWGIFVAAAGGVLIAFRQRQAAGIAAASIIISVLAGSFVIRAMSEPRHFIIVLPALLLAAVLCFQWARQQTRFALIVPVAALALFPFQFYRQHPAGYTTLAGEVPLPSRMLVSSDATGEGAWIAVVALREKRPASTIARATKVLASTSWTGWDYVSRVKTPAEVERKLDELEIDTAVLVPSGGIPTRPHQVLLQQTLRDSPAWRLSASAGQMLAYRRVRAPAAPRRPMEIDLRDKIGTVVGEH